MKVALVTGGSRGIGLYTVRRLVNSGYKVITCSRSKSNWLESQTKYPELDAVDYQEVDLIVEAELEGLFEYIDKQYGRLDVAVNNASPQIASIGNFNEINNDLLKETLHIDFWAQALCLKHEINLMKEGSSIVNVSSVNGLRPTPNASMYSASKHAIEGLTRSIAIETISKGIRVNNVAPGVTWTPRWEQREKDNPSVKDDVSEVVPMKRFASIDEVVDAIEFLLSEKASYIVGHTLVVDGGLSLRGA
ncbi:SDR family NAD(P)-dependent oxidoreductase [Vibrio hepatarius]|uniref:SDR family NAD(P)-dependent oxidoreductase n=1 Tax=Vibrio hepatarius TaxID=171383 RepID=UPI00142DEDE5|nr:SDR family oxidoreductase [Vibrio hepatarius]NIY85158.1 SDR family oxidoreductase [Vibrio hepatarius]NVJ55241.1 SDR family oxidoreductase [Vibrionaceae bacterium]